MSSTQVTQKHQQQKNNQVLQLLTGGISGALSRTAVAPVERTIILRQTKSPQYMNLSIIPLIKKMWKTEGFLSLFKGNFPNCLRITPFQAIEFFMNDFYKQCLTERQLFENSKTQKYLISGALAGATATIFVYPLDYLKTALAVNTQKAGTQENMLRLSLNLVKNNGFLSLYTGMKLTILGMMPYASLKLTIFQTLKDKYMQKYEVQKMGTFVNLSFGCLAGCIAVTITYPTDLIRRRMQLSSLQGEQQIGIVQTFQSVLKQDSFRGLYSGLSATYLKIAPSTALVFAINEYLKNKLNIY